MTPERPIESLLTLDTTRPQVLIDVSGDVLIDVNPDDMGQNSPESADSYGHTWHARLLIISDGSGRWVCATPDGNIEDVNLTEHRVITLVRHVPTPLTSPIRSTASQFGHRGLLQN